MMSEILPMPDFLKPRPTPANARQVDGNHYVSQSIQPWDAMAAWMTPDQFKGFLRGNAIKYMARAGSKGGALTDYLKAQHYLERLIEVERESPGQ